MTGQSISIYLNDKLIFIIKKTLKHYEAKDYKLKEPNDVIKFGLKLVKRYFKIEEPVPKELREIWDWI